MICRLINKLQSGFFFNKRTHYFLTASNSIRDLNGRCIDPSRAQMCRKQTNFHIKWDCTSWLESTSSHHLKNSQTSLKISHMGDFLDQDFDIQSSFGVRKVQVESNEVSKTVIRSKIHWANAEIFTLFWRKSCQITIVEKFEKFKIII